MISDADRELHTEKYPYLKNDNGNDEIDDKKEISSNIPEARILAVAGCEQETVVIDTDDIQHNGNNISEIEF